MVARTVCCRRWPGAWAALIAVALPCTASAEEPGTTDAAAAARAFAQGKTLFEQRDFVGAISEFQLAYRLRPHHAVQCSIARCYENLGKVIEAADHYRRCLREGADVTSIAEKIRNSLKQAEARIATVDVISPGRGGTISVDGTPVGLAPRRLRLNPGDRVIVVERTGANPARAKLELRAGEERTVTLVPEDLPTIVAQPAATRPADDDAPPPPRRRVRQHWFWTAVGLTVACAAATTALGVLTLQRLDDYNNDPTKDRFDEFRSYRMLTNVFVGLTAAAGATGTVLFFFTDFKRDTRPARDRDVALGVGWGGRF
jgi:hypothetical protein